MMMRYAEYDASTTTPAHASVAYRAQTHADGEAVKVRAPATCGELIQAHLDGEDFLVNCPIDLFAEAEVSAVGMLGLHMRSPEQHGKIIRALHRVASENQRDLSHIVHIHSPIPRGKGMASSTADITAAVAAFCKSAGIDLDDAAFGSLMTRIEPSDGVHFPGIAHVDHLEGVCHESLPVPRGLRVLVLDCGGEVDTVGFDRERSRAIYREHRDDVVWMLDTVRDGLRDHDLRRVAQAATTSARISQQILPKPPFEAVLERAIHEGALGVNCAHSGTVLGVMYEDSNPHLGERLRAAMIQELGEQYPVLGDFAVISGGVV